MFRYMFLCLLIAPRVFADCEFVNLCTPDCDHFWFECINNTRPLNDELENNEGWVRCSKQCDGIKDCADGSDEALMVCKLSSSYQLPDAFNCASGAMIQKRYRCDNNTNCWDNSDQLKCNNLTESSVEPRGQCGETELECLPGECISKSLWCDNKIDCSNGRDESIEQCFTICNETEFQCGYGTCIGEDRVCDNKPDCLDGADEVFSVCKGITNYRPYRNCSEPKPGRRSPKFADDTKYQIYDGYKYVWPNNPVHFTCPIGTQLEGSEWNVCQLDGNWHHKLPLCTVIHYNATVFNYRTRL